MKCAECTCDGNAENCNWIKSGTDTPTSPEAIAALLDGVTDGPWVWKRAKIGGDCAIGPIGIVMAESFADIRKAGECANDEAAANARFIAAARDLVPALAAERDALAARLAEVEVYGDKTYAALHGHRCRADDAEAERDTALAQVAVVYDVEAVACAIYSARGSAPYAWSDMTNGMKAPTREQAASVIRALTPATALAALQARDARIKGEVLEAALAAINSNVTPVKPATGWSDNAAEWHEIGQIDAAASFVFAIDALHTPATRAAKGGA